ncbi:MAG: FAD-dependent thymidylate synthase [Candidatus Moraniibacteriota bacterium]
MIEVKLINRDGIHPLAMAEYAAKLCYQGTIPEMKSGTGPSTAKFVDEKLFRTGHHTTLQHSNFSFQIEGIAVGDVTFGPHLTSPFYDSDQRSGRFCSEMFLNPNFDLIESYLCFFWPKEGSERIGKVMRYIRNGIRLYQENLDEATFLVEKFLREERPFASRNVLKGSGKIAQEQLRNFIPVVFPTALVYSVNISSLVALWESAWSPVMRHVTDLMKDRVLQEYPEVEFLFDKDRRRTSDWSPEISSSTGCQDRPVSILGSVSGRHLFSCPNPGGMHPVDTLRFRPELMDNSIGDISTTVSVLVATMGQDQRHRTIYRGVPYFTGSFYCPPLLEALGLRTVAEELLEEWKGLDVSPTLKTVIAPYGAAVSYRKRGSFNAVAHEQAKRLCWCAQEEIYELSRQLRKHIGERDHDSVLLRMFEPPCYRTGKCAEGDRYCGRDISKRKSGDYFPKRKV